MKSQTVEVILLLKAKVGLESTNLALTPCSARHGGKQKAVTGTDGKWRLLVSFKGDLGIS